MREITFRALKADGSNEWVYGYYRKWFNSSDGKEVHIISNDYGEGNLVIPETVGQFCGLTDKNGTRIFEGDIVKWVFNNADFKPSLQESVIKYQQYSDGWIGFEVYNNSEVIGNIHQK